MNKLFKIFLVSRIFSSLSDQILMFAVPLIVYKTTQSISLSGLAMFIEWLPRVISLPIAGSLNDRYGGWRIYCIADTIRAITCIFAIVCIFILPALLFHTLAALMAICAFYYSQAFISIESTLPLLVSIEDRPKAQSVLQGVDQSSMIAGPMIGTLCILWIDPLFLILFSGILFLISASMIFSLRYMLSNVTQHLKRGVSRNIFKDVRIGINIINSKPYLWKLIILSFIVNGTVGLSLATGAALTLGKFGESDSYFGILQVIVGLFSIASFLLITKLVQLFGLFHIGIFSYLGVAAGGLIMGFANNFIVFVVGFGLSLGLCGLFNVFIRTERLKMIPSEHLGKTISVIVLLNQLSLPLSGLLVSATGNLFSPQYLFLSNTALAIGFSLALLPSIRRDAQAVN